jgi:hypothetical protein
MMVVGADRTGLFVMCNQRCVSVQVLLSVVWVQIFIVFVFGECVSPPHYLVPGCSSLKQIKKQRQPTLMRLNWVI